MYEIINEIVEEYNFPVMYGFPAGHGQKNLPLIFESKLTAFENWDDRPKLADNFFKA